MAEIKIEKKSPVWPWILVALVVIGIVAWLLMRDNGDSDPMATAPEEQRTEQREERTTAATTTDRALEGDVQDYVTFVNSDRSMGLDHEYTSGALERLEKAVSSKANELNFDIQADLDKIDDHTGHITDDPMETSHANHIRSAADALSSAMRNMQRQHYPNLDQQAGQVEQAAQKIDPSTLTLDQKDAVKGFFDRSADLLRSMN